jgi:predicted RNase H-related nuclease YkuK (DUF458 family)
VDFISPTKGRLSFDQVFEEIMAYASENPEDSYASLWELILSFRDETCFVTALIVHRHGQGRKFLLYPQSRQPCPFLRQRIFL